MAASIQAWKTKEAHFGMILRRSTRLNSNHPIWNDPLKFKEP
tara:strand:- start:566 stop:691 length:126 start_codon:yes stop_codon:yes gene_type:complete